MEIDSPAFTRSISFGRRLRERPESTVFNNGCWRELGSCIQQTNKPLSPSFTPWREMNSKQIIDRKEPKPESPRRKQKKKILLTLNLALNCQCFNR